MAILDTEMTRLSVSASLCVSNSRIKGIRGGGPGVKFYISFVLMYVVGLFSSFQNGLICVLNSNPFSFYGR